MALRLAGDSLDLNGNQIRLRKLAHVNGTPNDAARMTPSFATSPTGSDVVSRVFPGSPYTSDRVARTALLKDHPAPKYLGKRGALIWAEILCGLGVTRAAPASLREVETYVWLHLQWQKVRRRVERQGYLLTSVNHKTLELEVVINPLVKHAEQLANQKRTVLSRVLSVATSRNNDMAMEDRVKAADHDVKENSDRGSLIGGKRITRSAA